jgi:hypothetical protein
VLQARIASRLKEERARLEARLEAQLEEERQALLDKKRKVQCNRGIRSSICKKVYVTVHLTVSG